MEPLAGDVRLTLRPLFSPVPTHVRLLKGLLRAYGYRLLLLEDVLPPVWPLSLPVVEAPEVPPR